jgi:hypothetical protein
MVKDHEMAKNELRSLIEASKSPETRRLERQIELDESERPGHCVVNVWMFGILAQTGFFAIQS